ncbi:MAG: rRNA maturation RNase YbeY [Longimicrobiales bacterium]
MKQVSVQVAPALARRTRERPSPASAATAALLRRAVRAALADVADAEVSLTLLDDDAIAALNQQWLKHDGPTDVISFPLYEPGESVVGDVYVGFDQVVRQARENDAPVREELARVAIHGTLHVLGYDHPDGRARLRSTMWKRQERIVREVMG